ncbi:MAG: hypothetical protein H6502_02300 [Candidatus Woesearchaeota archaeon]|nr:MAG: hypothetical protein H6502_02300 [Candidatus Woesearchaeota archaeon]
MIQIEDLRLNKNLVLLALFGVGGFLTLYFFVNMLFGSPSGLAIGTPSYCDSTKELEFVIHSEQDFFQKIKLLESAEALSSTDVATLKEYAQYIDWEASFKAGELIISEEFSDWPQIPRCRSCSGTVGSCSGLCVGLNLKLNGDFLFKINYHF